MAKETKKAADPLAAGGPSPNYYQVTIKDGVGWFDQNLQTQFLPGNTYTVSADIYNGNIPGGGKFTDQCASAVPLDIPQPS